MGVLSGGPGSRFIRVSAQTADDSPADIWSVPDTDASAWALVHVQRGSGATRQVHTFTLQGVKYVIEGSPNVLSEQNEQTGSTGGPALAVAFALAGGTDLALRVTGEPATTIAWEAFILKLPRV